MSDKKIFIALSQREARSVLTAIQFITTGCSKMNGEDVQFNPENAEVIGITAEELAELWDFSDKLQNLANEQAALEVQNSERNIDIREIPVLPDFPDSNISH